MWNTKYGGYVKKWFLPRRALCSFKYPEEWGKMAKKEIKSDSLDKLIWKTNEVTAQVVQNASKKFAGD
jgi:hypothetical protein